ncbi:MAG: hypothetical protein KBB95_03310 [Deltaproteobacteria bacterium]|nr:hypothetical protein [Deltaproteobacteria bacterium]
MTTRRQSQLSALFVCAFALSPVACGGSGGGPTPELIVEVDGVDRTTEVGAQARVTVALSARPRRPVMVPVASSDTTEGSVSVPTLTFTRDNWNAPQTVVVSGEDDSVVDGDQTYNIAFGPSSSADADFEGLSGSAVLTNTDDESAGLTLSAISGDSREDGTQASFTVVLNAPPASDVTVTLASDDATEGTIAPATLTFTTANWNAPQTVLITGVDDADIDGDQVFHVGVTGVSSTAPGYMGLVVSERVTVTNVDDDMPGFLVSAVTGNTREDGTPASFTVALTFPPTADVTINFMSDDSSEGVATESSLTFTPVNWNAPQQISVAGANDDIEDGDQPFNVVFSATTSADSVYAALRPETVALTNEDDDTLAILVTAPTADTTEAGGTATFSVRLGTIPSADVTVNFATSDASEGSTDVTSLTFTTANFGVAQTVVITGQGDDIDDGDQPYAVAFGATTSDDAAYAAITPADLMLTNEDDDSADINVTVNDDTSGETGDTAEFSVVLASEPEADVTLTFDTTDSSEGTPSTTSITFTAGDWDVAQVVTITGQNDDVVDGNQPFRVDFAAVTSGDAVYAAIAVANLDFTNDDDDMAGINVSDASSDTTEGGGTATFTIVLNSEPTADVTLTFDSDDALEGTLDITSVTFTPADWDLPRTVTVTGQADGMVDGNAVYGIDFDASTSADPLYAGITPTSVALTNLETLVFAFTGAPQTFVVPNVTSLHVIVDGAQGGANWVDNVNFGGRTEATIAVTPGETLTVFVGEQPTSLAGGFNGGGAGETGGRGGGGASDIRRGGIALTDRVVVAGGGGGAGFWSNLHVIGGVGGGLQGADGSRNGTDPGGVGATQSAPGPYGTCASLMNPVTAGAFGVGGAPSGCGCEGYGGGGGWYGGAGSGNCRGGGGGSGYVDPVGSTNVVLTAGGAAPGNGSVTIRYE